jgi:hypothetical protein
MDQLQSNIQETHRQKSWHLFFHQLLVLLVPEHTSFELYGLFGFAEKISKVINLGKVHEQEGQETNAQHHL